MTRQFDIVRLESKPELVDEVIKLADTSKKTLGFLPRGAFEEHVDDILVAIATEPASKLVGGYLLYRFNRTSGTVVIVQLCVSPDCRRMGIARALFEGLKQLIRHQGSIRVRCRRDYPANAVWPRLGFELEGEIEGRGVDKAPINVWRYPLPTPRLFPLYETAREKAMVAIDSMVFFDFFRTHPDAEESRGLLEEWIRELADVAITPELNGDINRSSCKEERVQGMRLAAQFGCVGANPEVVQEHLLRVRSILGEPETPQDESDRRHVAHAAAGGADYFVTRDTGILLVSAEIQEEFGLVVLRPSDLIAHIHKLEDSSDYAPVRLQSTSIQRQQVSRIDESHIVHNYLRNGFGEKKHELLRVLRESLSTAGRIRTDEYYTEEGQALLLLTQDRSISSMLRIPVVRMTSHTLASTVVRQALANAAGSGRASVVCVTDQRIDRGTSKALEDCGFAETPEGWVRFAVSKVGAANEAIDLVRELEKKHGIAHPLLEAPVASSEMTLERSLWPCKFTDSGTECFIIPIRPHWAEALFESRLASDLLFGSPAEISLRLENVYYRAAQPRVLAAPGRILWYVSGKSAVRAASYIDEVAIGPARDLFRDYRRLGVYDWRQVLDTAKREPNRPIMAVRFSGTELLEPVPLQELREAFLRHTGKSNQVQAPVRIPEEMYFDLYRPLPEST